jgi:aspartate carbamoyltransferase regulatory subunit
MLASSEALGSQVSLDQLIKDWLEASRIKHRFYYTAHRPASIQCQCCDGRVAIIREDSVSILLTDMVLRAADPEFLGKLEVALLEQVEPTLRCENGSN